MKVVISSVIMFILGAGLFLGSAIVQYRYGAAQDPDASFVLLGISMSYGMGLFLVVMHGIKCLVYSQTIAKWSDWTAGNKLLAGTATGLFAVAGLASTVSWQVILREVAESSRAAQVQAHTDLRDELGRTEQRLLTAGWGRPLETVAAEIRAEQRDRLWDASQGCRSTPTRDLRAYCAGIDKLMGEEAAANDARELRRRADDIRAKLIASPPVPRAAPDIIWIARLFAVSPESVFLIRAAFLAVLCEFAEFVCVWLFAQKSAPPARIPTTARGRSAGLGIAPTRVLQPGIDGLAPTPYPPSRSGGLPTVRATDQADRGQVAPYCSSDSGVDACPTNNAEPIQPAQSDRLLAQQARDLPAQSILGETTSRDPALGRDGQAQAGTMPIRPPVPGGAAAAVQAFVDTLLHGPADRASGSELYDHYQKLREAGGWPELAPNIFGRHLRVAVKAVGGRKIKSNGQVYVGVGLPVSGRSANALANGQGRTPGTHVPNCSARASSLAGTRRHAAAIP